MGMKSKSQVKGHCGDTIYYLIPEIAILDFFFKEKNITCSL